MGACWHCYWGWPEPVAEIYLRATRELGEHVVEHGPACWVFGEENFGSDAIQDAIDSTRSIDIWIIKLGITLGELDRLRDYLEEVLAIPESVRDCRPADYDDENPEAYPPPSNMVLVNAAVYCATH